MRAQLGKNRNNDYAGFETTVYNYTDSNGLASMGWGRVVVADAGNGLLDLAGMLSTVTRINQDQSDNDRVGLR